LRKFLGLVNYLHKYSKNSAHLIHPLSQLLRKDVAWKWSDECQTAFTTVKQSLMESPILAIADYDRPFHVVCDASNLAVGAALLQVDGEGIERVVSYQSRQLKQAERNYPVHDRELLAMKYALAKFRVYLLGTKHFTVFTDHCSLRTAIKSPHLSQRMARWLSFFAEYNFTVEYKPGKLNVLADALSRRPDYESETSSDSPVVNSTYQLSSSLRDEVKAAYGLDPMFKPLVDYLTLPTNRVKATLPKGVQARLHRYSIQDGLVHFSTDDGSELRVLVPNDEDLRRRILFEYHDTPTAGHPGREKTYISINRDFYWPHMDRWVRKYVRTCEVCQRSKTGPGSQAPLRSLPIPTECWKSVSLDFVFGLPADGRGHNGLLVIVCRFSKMVHLVPVSDRITGRQCAKVFLDTVFRLHGLPAELVSDRDPRFTQGFWNELFQILGTHLKMSTSHHPQTDGQTERVNRVVLTMLRCYAHAFQHWSDYLPMVEFAINNSKHASTGYTPFFLNGMRSPSVPASLKGDVLSLGGGGPSSSLPRNASTMTMSAQNDVPASNPGSDRNVSACDRILSQGFNTQDTIRTKCECTPSLSERNPAHKRNNNRRGRLKANMFIKRKFKRNGQTMDISTLSANSRRANALRSRDLNEFVLKRQAIVRYVRDALARAVDRQKEQADKFGRKRTDSYAVGSLVLLSTANLPPESVSNLGSNKLLPRYIGPFRVVHRRGDAYTLDIPSVMKLHPTFYIGRIKPYHPDDPGHLDHPNTGTRPLASPQTEAAPDLPPPPDHSRRVPRRISFASPLETPGCGATPHPPQSGLGPRRAARRASASCPLVPRSGEFAPRGNRDDGPIGPSGEPSDGDVLAQRGPPSRVARTSLALRSWSGHPARAPPPIVDSDGDPHFVVERISSHRDVGRIRHTRTRGRTNSSDPLARQYLVKWRGYPDSESTWEPRASLRRDIPDLVREYESQLPKQQQVSGQLLLPQVPGA
jgi:hypothetical protein